MDRLLYHISVGVSDMRNARAFYAAILSPLDCRLLCEIKDSNGEDVSLGWGKTFPELWVNLPLDGGKAGAANGVHMAFFAADKTSVDRFHVAALATGGGDAGAPGYRPEYQPGYYAAFVLDPDGNKLEAVWLDQSKQGTSLA